MPGIRCSKETQWSISGLTIGASTQAVAVSDDKHDGGIAVIHAMPTALGRKR